MKPINKARPNFVKDFNMFGEYKDTINEIKEGNPPTNEKGYI